MRLSLLYRLELSEIKYPSCDTIFNKLRSITCTSVCVIFISYIQLWVASGGHKRFGFRNSLLPIFSSLRKVEGSSDTSKFTSPIGLSISTVSKWVVARGYWLMPLQKCSAVCCEISQPAPKLLTDCHRLVTAYFTDHLSVNQSI